MDCLLRNGEYSEVAKKARDHIKPIIAQLFDKYAGQLSREAIFSLIVNAAVVDMADKKLLEEDPFSDDDQLATSFATKIMELVESEINSSNLPSEIITAYGAKAINGLAIMRDY